MLAAITGGTGFIGRHLTAHHRQAGDRVRILSRQPTALGTQMGVDPIQGDLTDPSFDLEPFLDGADVLYHCAAELRDPSKMQPLHVEGTRRLLRAALGRIDRWVQLSSVGVYGAQGLGLVDENSPCRPVGLYETTKLLADQEVEGFCQANGMPHCIVRPSTVLGPDMTNRSLAQWIDFIDRGLFFFVGPSGAVANYMHVDSMVAAMALCARHDRAVGQTYILSEAISIEDFVGIICEALGRQPVRLRLSERPLRGIARSFSRVPRFPLTQARIEALTNRTVYVSQKISDELQYQPVIPLGEGLRQTVVALRRG